MIGHDRYITTVHQGNGIFGYSYGDRKAIAYNPARCWSIPERWAA
jgi:hypothetical protein